MAIGHGRTLYRPTRGAGGRDSIHAHLGEFQGGGVRFAADHHSDLPNGVQVYSPRYFGRLSPD